MNSAQRKLVLLALVALALVLHLWNLRWAMVEWQPYYGGSEPPGRFAAVSWSAEPDVPAYFTGWSPDLADFDEYAGMKSWHAWGVRMWKQYEASGKQVAWESYLRSSSRATHYFGLWRTGPVERAWIWGVFAPSGVGLLALFLVLGWRKPSRYMDHKDAAPSE